MVKVLAEQFDFKNVKVLKDDLKITNDRYAVFATPTTIIIKDGMIKDRILGENHGNFSNPSLFLCFNHSFIFCSL